MNYRLFLSSLIICTSLSLSGCKTSTPEVEKTSATNNSTTEIADNQTTNNQNNLTDKVKFKLENGDEAFSLKPKDNGMKVEGVNGSEIARLTVDERQKIKIKDPSDRPLGYVITKDNAWKLENAEQNKELYILRKQTDGDYKLETGDDKQVYRIKRRDYGWEIETPQKQSLYKVKIKANKIVLRDRNEVTVIKTKANIPSLAVACYGFDVLSQPQQSALAYAISLTGE